MGGYWGYRGVGLWGVNPLGDKFEAKFGTIWSHLGDKFEATSETFGFKLITGWLLTQGCSASYSLKVAQVRNLERWVGR